MNLRNIKLYRIRKAILLFILSTLWIVACTRKDTISTDRHFAVDGLSDFEISQNRDTVFLPVHIKSQTGELPQLTVLNLPENLKMSVSVKDSLNGEFLLRFITYVQANFNQRPQVAPFGVFNTKLVVSGDNNVEQFEFKISVKKHWAFMLSGYYNQTCTCDVDTIANNSVFVYIDNYNNSDAAIFLHDLIYLGKTQMIYFFIDSAKSGKIVPQTVRSTLGNYPFLTQGNYNDQEIHLSLDSYSSDTCQVVLTRKK